MGQYPEKQETDSHPATLKPRTAAARSGHQLTTTTLGGLDYRVLGKLGDNNDNYTQSWVISSSNSTMAGNLARSGSSLNVG